MAGYSPDSSGLVQKAMNMEVISVFGWLWHKYLSSPLLCSFLFAKNQNHKYYDILSPLAGTAREWPGLQGGLWSLGLGQCQLCPCSPRWSSDPPTHQGASLWTDWEKHRSVPVFQVSQMLSTDEMLNSDMSTTASCHLGLRPNCCLSERKTKILKYSTVYLKQFLAHFSFYPQDSYVKEAGHYLPLHRWNSGYR